MKSLLTLSTELENLCEQIEEGKDITDEFLTEFGSAKLQHAEKVDNWCHVLRTITHNSAVYSERSETFARRAKTLENLELKLKDYLKMTIKAHPNLPWSGTEGDKIRVQKSPESLKLNISLDKRSFTNVMYGEGIDKYRNFIDVTTLYLLNKEKVKAYLQAGNELDWAKLEQGDHVRWG